MITIPVGGTYHRVVDPSWSDRLDATRAARTGQRWNPPGIPCLYVNEDRATARANVARLFLGRPYGPADLDPETAPLLIDVDLPAGQALDVSTPDGAAALGLPASYPIDVDGLVVSHDQCQPHGRNAWEAGLDGVAARSAAPGAPGNELAWFPRLGQPAVVARHPFTTWYYAPG